MRRDRQKAMFAKKNVFNRRNIAKVPTESGVYELFDKDKQLLYVGVSKKGKFGNLRHRLESYYEKDNFKEHPTKKNLRAKIDKFSFKTIPISEARRIERENKGNTQFNMDHNIGRWER